MNMPLSINILVRHRWSKTDIRLEALAVSYNGGKDCLVLLLLYLSCLADEDEIPERLSSIYIPHLSPFPLVDDFVRSSSERYCLDLKWQPPRPELSAGAGMKEAFGAYLASATGSRIRAIFVGTRRTDPHGARLAAFEATDHGWPAFMRVHPVLDWHYVEIWAFLRHLKVDYCALYDAGYTSLGGVGDTYPNPVLKVELNGHIGYRPAFELQADDEERLGRE